MNIPTTNTDKNTEKIKKLAEEYDFDKFDIDGDGKLNDTELTRLKQVFTTVDFDEDEEGCVDETAFNNAIS